MKRLPSAPAQAVSGPAGSVFGYRVFQAVGPAGIRAAQRLRFEVFNLELKEGLPESHLTGLDADAFDPVCDHLLVEQAGTGEVVGTYRLQPGLRAATHLGYYSEQEFDFAPYEEIRAQTIELGRACVHRDHRNLQVLGLLWKGIADYARAHQARFLIGCSSLTSQNPADGAWAYSELYRKHLAPSPWRTVPRPRFECPVDQLQGEPPKIPKLLRAYLALGAWICGPPAIDRQFKTIDFLTLLDLDQLPELARLKFLG